MKKIPAMCLDPSSTLDIWKSRNTKELMVFHPFVSHILMYLKVRENMFVDCSDWKTLDRK